MEVEDCLLVSIVLMAAPPILMLCYLSVFIVLKLLEMFELVVAGGFLLWLVASLCEAKGGADGMHRLVARGSTLIVLKF